MTLEGDDRFRDNFDDGPTMATTLGGGGITESSRISTLRPWAAGHLEGSLA